MKKLLLLVAIAATMMSCDTHEKVKLSNGAYIDAVNNTDVNYHQFDEVCVQNTQGKWSICGDGEFRDTVIVRASGNIKHKTGKILNRL